MAGTKPLALLVLAACGGGAEISVEVEVAGDPATVSYRVWDERHELVRDVVLPASDFPRVLRLFPDTSDATPIAQRWARVEVELWSAAGCPFGRAIGTYRYRDDGRDELLSVSPSSASRECTVLHVDARASGDCSEGAPCRTIQEAIDRGNDVAGRVIVLVAGDAEYPPFGVRLAFADRSAADPNVIRAWPGRSLVLPHVHATEGHSAIDTCCDSQRGFNDPAIGLEIDGFEVSGGERTGVELNGADQVSLRNCDVHDNGFENDSVERGGIRVISSVDVVVEHNLVRDNRHPTGLAPVTGIVVGYWYDGDPMGSIRDNRILENQDAGIRVFDIDASVSFTGNTICANGGRGMWIEPNEGTPGAGSIDFAQNAVLDNAGRGLEIEWTGPVRVVANTFANDAAGSYELRGPGRPMLDRNILSGGTGEFDGENLVDAALRVASGDCLLAPPAASAGTCADFPSCPSPF